MLAEITSSSPNKYKHSCQTTLTAAKSARWSTAQLLLCKSSLYICVFSLQLIFCLYLCAAAVRGRDLIMAGSEVVLKPTDLDSRHQQQA